MEKVFTYTFIGIGLMILFYFAGFQETLTGGILGTFDITEPTQIGEKTRGSDWADIIIDNIFLLSVSAAVGLLLWYRGQADIALGATFATAILIGLFQDFVSVFDYLVKTETEWIGAVGIMIMGPFIILFGLALFDWVRGKD